MIKNPCLILSAFLLFIATTALPCQAAENQAKDDRQRVLQFDTTIVGHRQVIIEITLPDGGKVTRVTEPLPGRDGKEGGFRVLKGYRLPNGKIVAKDVHRNTDGTISIFDVDNDASHPDRHEERFTEQEFIQWVKNQQSN